MKLIRRRTATSQRRRISPLVLLLVVGIVVVAWTVPVAHIGAGKRQQKIRTIKRDLILSGELRVDSKVLGLEIVKLEKQLEPDTINVWLRNSSDKAITGYKVGVGIGVIQSEFLQSDDDSKVLRPGMTTQERYAFQAELETRGVVVLAAIFDDGSARGQTKFVRDLRQYRDGMKIERDHALPLLKQIAGAQQSQMVSEFSNIEARLPALSSEEEKALQAHVRIGYHDQLRMFTSQMRSLSRAVQESAGGGPQAPKYPNLNLREELLGYVGRYEKISRILVGGNPN